MNAKNLEFLKDQVKFTGFGESLHDQLEQNLKRQAPEFTLQHQATFGRDQADTSLHFKKSAASDMYFFNSYLVSLNKEQQAEKINQAFYINKDHNITLKEGYNLMSGRAVHKELANKEGQLYKAWLQMDFKQTDQAGNFKLKQFHQNYGFELHKELSKYPIKELSNEQDRSRLIESLQKGNRQAVTFVGEGTEQKRFIEANPQFKSITVYDGNMHKITARQSQSQQQSQSEKLENGQKVKEPKQEQIQQPAGNKKQKDKSMSISQ